jgi:hypothetical protein
MDDSVSGIWLMEYVMGMRKEVRGRWKATEVSAEVNVQESVHFGDEERSWGCA